MICFVPLSVAELSALRTTPLAGPVAAFAVTDGLRDTFDLAGHEDEEADRTALLLAALSGLARHGRRLVATVEGVAVDHHGTLGEVTLAELAWPDVTALFADEPEAADAVSAAATAVAALELDAAWDDAAAQALMSDHDLLWFGPEEVDAVLGTERWSSATA